ncbi:hypothetical protein IEQ34_008436 [Dendrobium chrysotoxum]|uniref:Uncharacterized protein n=1 Tax=Dendrobium chrysotoxum TaxID=161865 RepID=A0AAV7GVW2_DENCH|nr:hypothetical protein IEQ34_008436 [Dendrobium chrysotoxum]
MILRSFGAISSNQEYYPEDSSGRPEEKPERSEENNLIVQDDTYIVLIETGSVEATKQDLRDFDRDSEQNFDEDERQSKDSMWFRASESPMKASFFPLTMARKIFGSNLGMSQPSGFHLQYIYPFSFPYLPQFFSSGNVLQLSLV